jgi:ankyrin repeat protein
VCFYLCFLIGCATPNEQLEKAIYEGNLEQAQQSLKNGADPCSALMSAVEHKQVNIARLLLSHGANPNKSDTILLIDELLLIDTRTNTQLSVSPRHWRPNVNWNDNAYILLCRLAPLPEDPDTRLKILATLQSRQYYYRYKLKESLNDRTPLYTAIDNNDTEMVRILLEYGADAGKPCVAEVASPFYPKADDYLLKVGSWSPSESLIFATIMNGGDIITDKAYFRHQGDYIISNICPVQGTVATAIEYARSQGKTELVQILESSAKSR